MSIEELFDVETLARDQRIEAIPLLVTYPKHHGHRKHPQAPTSTEIPASSATN
ncbi:hypothetical protein ACIBI9_40995 [Nonomuraea sp. NPDC050451]|uniref:hypothetical protein n=1 Tax=Nonomuraea sp. NPDC050451 TaxID=3364364 RepID=UPI0037ABD423